LLYLNDLTVVWYLRIAAGRKQVNEPSVRNLESEERSKWLIRKTKELLFHWR
jgi:hypothetical protein